MGYPLHNGLDVNPIKFVIVGIGMGGLLEIITYNTVTDLGPAAYVDRAQKHKSLLEITGASAVM